MLASDSKNRNKLVALIVTVLFHAMIAGVMVAIMMRYSGSDNSDRTWPPIDSAEVLFGGEYVMIGDSPEMAENNTDAAPTDADATLPAPPEAEAIENSGEPAEAPAPVMASERQSPAKTEARPSPEKSGPSKAEREAEERAKREEAARNAIESRVKFNKNGSGGAGEGKAGNPDGNSTIGATSGTPGFNLKGRTLDDWTMPPKGPLGSVTVTVKVNRQGIVTEASYLSGSGAAAASQTTRRNCEKAARASKFSVDNNAPASQSGTITYNFR